MEVPSGLSQGLRLVRSSSDLGLAWECPGPQAQGLVGLSFLMGFPVTRAQHTQLAPTLETGPFWPWVLA